MTDKKTLRARLRRQRASLSQRAIQHASKIVAEQLFRLPTFRRAHRIGLYMASKGEIDTHLILERSLSLGKQCYLPVLHPYHPGRLWFTRWQPGDPLQPNKYDISEPIAHHARMIKPYSLDLVLMPLLGFDQDGNRLGMGKGYYDRCFAYLHRREHWQKPELIGLAHDFQKLNGLVPSSWDVPLIQAVTEARTYGPFARGKSQPPS